MTRSTELQKQKGHVTNFPQTRLTGFLFLPHSTEPCSNKGADDGRCALRQMWISVITLMLHTTHPDRHQLCPTDIVTSKVNF